MMTKRLSAVLASFLLLSVKVSFGSASGLPDTTENIHLGLVTDSRVPNLGVLAGKVDYIYAAAPSAGAPPSGIYLDGYLTYDRDDTNKSISWFQANHSDWVVYKCDASTIAYEFGNPNVPIDITTSAVQSYQMQEVASQFASVPYGFAFNGIAWDNVETINPIARCGVWAGSTWVQHYSGAYIDPVYSNSIASWADNIYTAMQNEFPGKGMSMNLSSGPTGYSNPQFVNISSLFPYLDMVVDERGFTAYGGGPLTDADWANEVSNLETLNQMNKGFFLPSEWNNVPNDASISHAQINWTLANYLLVKGQHSYVNIYPLWQGVQGYGNFYDRPEYHVAIGHATSGRYSYQGVQRRDYSGGMTLVNPSSSVSYTVTLPATYTDLWGNNLTSLTLGPASAEVLLGAGSSGSGSGSLQVAGVSPNSGSGSTQSFAFSISDPGGYTAVSDVNVMINSSYTNGANSCWFHYYRPTNQIQLSYDNTPSTFTWQPAVALGTGTEQNSQCSINIGGASVSGSGSTLTLHVPITFNSSWDGTKNIYVYANDRSGASIGYADKGNWVVP